MYFTATYLHRTFAFNAVLPPFETLEQPVALAVSVLTCRTSGVRTAYIYIYIYIPKYKMVGVLPIPTA